MNSPENKRDQTECSHRSEHRAPVHCETVPPPVQCQTVPKWFVTMLIAMLILSILAIWIIPADLMLRWSMWWNNIPMN